MHHPLLLSIIITVVITIILTFTTSFTSALRNEANRNYLKQQLAQAAQNPTGDPLIFDNSERSWYARYKTEEKLRQKLESKNKNKNNNKKGIVDSSYFVPEDSTRCKEIRSLDDLRVFLSTNKQAWILFYSATSFSTSTSLESVQSSWARFSSIVTFGKTGAVVGVVNITEYPHILETHPQLDGFEIEDEDDDNENDEQEEDEEGNSKNVLSAAQRELLRIKAREEKKQRKLKMLEQIKDPSFRIRYYALGPKFLKEQVEETEDQTVTFSSELRNGAADTVNSAPRKANRYNLTSSDSLALDYRDLVASAQNVFHSRVIVIDEGTVQTLQQFQETIVTPKTPKYRKSLILLVPPTNDNVITEGAQFCLHWVSRQFFHKDLAENYNANDKKIGFFDGRIAFVIVKSDSHLGKELIKDLGEHYSLNLLERIGFDLLHHDFDKKENRFITRRFTETPDLEDWRNIARALSTTVAPDIQNILKPPLPPPSPSSSSSSSEQQQTKKYGNKIIAAPECSTIKECFKKHPRVPFVVRNSPEFAAFPENTAESVVEKLRSFAGDEYEFVEGVTQLDGDPAFMQVDEALDRLFNNTLHFNVLDGGGISEWFKTPQILKDHDTFKEDRLTSTGRTIVILSPENSHTMLHYDPPPHSHISQAIFRGNKTFQMISTKYHSILDCEVHDEEDEEGNGEADNSFCRKTPEQVFEEDGIEVEIFQTTIGAGDFVMWPPSFVHRVWTSAQTISANLYVVLR